MNKHKYAIQRDKLMSADEGRPDRWLSIMVHAHPVDPQEIEDRCDLSGLLDEGETLDDYLSNYPDTICFVAKSEGMPHVYFMQQSGFEFIFTHDGRAPVLMPLTDDQVLDHLMSLKDPMARLLFGPNDPRNNGNYGFEREMARPQVCVRHISSASTERFILEIEGRAISGIAVKGAVVDGIFTRPEYRRQGLASQLFAQAELVLGHIEHSDSLTEAGRHFSQSFSASRHRP